MEVPFYLFPEDDHAFENLEEVLPLIQKCFDSSKNENEILSGVDVAFRFCLKCHFVSKLEEELLQCACITTKILFTKKLKFLENLNNNSDTLPGDTTASHSQILDICLKMLSSVIKVYEHVDKLPEVAVEQISSLLINSAEIIHAGFFHCKISQSVFSSQTTTLTVSLSNLFEECSKLLKQFSDFVIKKFNGEFCGEEEKRILNEVLTYTSRSGIILINLEVKTMVTAWKTFTFLIEKYIFYLRDYFKIDDTVNCLCTYIVSKLNIMLQINQGCSDVSKSVKLACFALKLVIKYCELFSGHLKNCQNSMLNLLLKQCQCCILSIKTERVGNNNEEFINQLTIGADPLLSLLVSDEELVKQCSIIVGDFSVIKSRSAEFSLLCCLIFKKLIYSNNATRKLWFSNGNNLLQWLFECTAFGKLHFCTNSQMSNTLVSGMKKKVTGLYEHVLVTTSAYLITVTSVDFSLIENTLIKNLMQRNLAKALLAIDVWCIVARFTDSNLCLAQIHNLVKIYHEIEDGSFRVQKWYLKSLIFRLISILSESQREININLFQPFSTFKLCRGNEVSNLNSYEVYDIIKYKEMRQLFTDEAVFEDFHLELEEAKHDDWVLSKKLERNIVNLWKFNCNVLASCSQSVKFIKIICALTAFFISQMSSDSLSQVLRTIKRLGVSRQQPCIKLYITWILSGLSRAEFPGFQQSVAEIFHLLLLSKEVVVKQKMFEIFYSFSHITSHSDVIILSVNDSSSLKTQMKSYFQKTPLCLPDYDLLKYIGALHQMQYEHICHSLEPKICREVEKIQIEKTPIHVQEIIDRWKKDGESIIKNVEFLTKSQIGEIKDFSNLILSLLHLN